MNLYRNLILTCMVLGAFFAKGQNADAGYIMNYSLSADEAMAVYRESMYDSTEYIDGKELKLFFSITKSNPILNNELGEGTVFVDGEAYPNLILAYDVFNDELLNIPTNKEMRFYYVQLKKETIDSFYVRANDEEFVLHQLDPINESLPKGFYEIERLKNTHLLFDFVCTENKQDGYTEFMHDLDAYLFVNNKYTKINSRKKLINIYPEHKKLIKRKVFQMEVPFRQLNKYQLIEIMNYVETL